MSKRLLPSAVIFAKDVNGLAGFYRNVLEMTEVQADADHVVLEAEGFQLVIHGIPAAIAASFEISTPPEIRGETPIKLCLPVSCLAAARQQARALGGGMGSPDREWTARNFRACDGFDPEGNVFQARESAADDAGRHDG